MRFVHASVVILAVGSAGCVPIPNFRYYAPGVSGVITDDGKPVVNAQVRVSGPFASESSSASTGDTGRFATVPIRKLLLAASLIGDPLYAYAVDVTVGDKQYAGYAEAGVGYAPKAVEVRCDLSRTIRRGSRLFRCEAVPANER